MRCRSRRGRRHARRATHCVSFMYRRAFWCLDTFSARSPPSAYSITTHSSSLRSFRNASRKPITLGWRVAARKRTSFSASSTSRSLMEPMATFLSAYSFASLLRCTCCRPSHGGASTREAAPREPSPRNRGYAGRRGGARRRAAQLCATNGAAQPRAWTPTACARRPVAATGRPAEGPAANHSLHSPRRHREAPREVAPPRGDAASSCADGRRGMVPAVNTPQRTRYTSPKAPFPRSRFTLNSLSRLYPGSESWDAMAAVIDGGAAAQ